eukprot:jgi/Hompol1/4194/HPOL_001750-RA
MGIPLQSSSGKSASNNSSNEVPAQSNKESTETMLQAILSKLAEPASLVALFWTALVLAEILLCAAIIAFIPYTEIDWTTYMQQVTAFLGGQFDYAQLSGDTGPLVYPAGFVYLYSVLHAVTNGGVNILRGQICFAAIYVASFVVVTLIYRRSKIFPIWALPLLILSKRNHSIYLLRLFNDPIAMFFLYCSVLLLLKRSWERASVLFSLALAVKMNILLFAPGFAWIVIREAGFVRAVGNGVIIAAIQILYGLPFLLHQPINYLVGAFNFGRQFLYKWTVNWRFVPEDHASRLRLAKILSDLTGDTTQDWIAALSITDKNPDLPSSQLSVDDMLLIMFSCNLIGITTARSLHYQFYSWYFFTIPYLLWRTRLHVALKLAIFAAIEWAWNVYPSTNTSSGVLLVCHIAILASIVTTEYNYSSKTKRPLVSAVQSARSKKLE